MRILKGMSSSTPEEFFSGSGEFFEYVWGNNSKRAGYKGRICKIIARGKMNSVLIEFENGERTVTSKWALRKITIP